MSCREHLHLSRRRLLQGGASLALWGYMPRGSALAGTRDPRLLCVVLRGGVDGLALAAPVGDPLYEGLRGALAIPRSGEGAGLALDSFFALNAAMPFLHSLYQRKEALIVHAVASPYRQRSHFDGQDVLESGLPKVARSDDGWLNRALAGLPAAGQASARNGLAIGTIVPLVMRGKAPVLSWTPKAYDVGLRESTTMRLSALYAESDPRLAKAFADGLALDKTGKQAEAGAMRAGPFRAFIETAEAAARFMSAADGPRIGALSYDGWDTHANEGAVKGALAGRLSGLDQAIKAYAEGMGAAWKDTVVVLMTEFGRTARVNGTNGTDHGTATVALLVGGAVKGGRMLADWPGLAEQALHEGRDLAPTRDLRSVLKGVLRDHLGIPEGALGTTIFPGSEAVLAQDGLLI